VSETEVLPEQGTRVREDTKPDLSHGDGDHERFAHYVDKSKIVDSMVTGTPVTALCGKVWARRLGKTTGQDDWPNGVPGHAAPRQPVEFRPREHPASTQ
jgi:hypothetical protein